MSDNAAQSFQPTRAATKRSVPVLVWVLVLLVATVAFGSAVVYSGGLNSALELIGVSSLGNSGGGLGSVPRGNKTAGAPGSGTATGTAGEATSTASTGTTPSAEATASAGKSSKPAGSSGSSSKKIVRDPGLPASARAAMYRGQLRSQRPIGKLVGNQVVNLSLGTPRKSATKATVPLTVTYRDGTSASGTMTLNKYNSRWYFAGLSTSGDQTDPNPGSINSSVVQTIVRQHATRANQSMIVNGILGGGFKNAAVTSVSGGSGTATVNVALSGGTSAPENGQFVCISQTDGPTTYWFIARFSAK